MAVLPDISPTLAREDGRKFGERLVASELEPAFRNNNGKVPADVESTTVAAIETSMQDTLLEKHQSGMSSKCLEIFRKQAWRVVEKGLNNLRREYRRRG